jgi:hypothetical protein
MTAASDRGPGVAAAGRLERAYRRLLRRYYPPLYLRRHEDEILGVLMAAAQPGQHRPGTRESADLLWSALKIRLRMVLRDADSRPWAAAFGQAGGLLPLLMLVLKLTELLDQGARYGFGSPTDILIGAYGSPGAYTRSFQLNSHSVALAGNVTSALTAGPVPALLLAGLAGLGFRRTAAIVAASIPAAYLAVSLTSGYTLLADPRGDWVLYAYGLEALILLAAPAAPRGWHALRWRPSVLLAAATVAGGVAISGGIWPLVHRHVREPVGTHPWELIRGQLAVPHGFIARLFGVGAGGWGDWLVYQGTLVAVIVVALLLMPVNSPVNRRVLFLLAVPFALAGVVYLGSLIDPAPSALAGNTLAVLPLLLILLAAVALRLRPRSPAGPDAPSKPETT